MFTGEGLHSPLSSLPLQHDIQLRIDDVIDGSGQVIERDNLPLVPPSADMPIDKNIAPFLVDEPVRLLDFLCYESRFAERVCL
jgi:hypothetical protein